MADNICRAWRRYGSCMNARYCRYEHPVQADYYRPLENHDKARQAYEIGDKRPHEYDAAGERRHVAPRLAFSSIDEFDPTLDKFEGRCEYCRTYTSLSVCFGCRRVGYCTKQCRLKDREAHREACSNPRAPSTEPPHQRDGQHDGRKLRGPIDHSTAQQNHEWPAQHPIESDVRLPQFAGQQSGLDPAATRRTAVNGEDDGASTVDGQVTREGQTTHPPTVAEKDTQVPTPDPRLAKRVRFRPTTAQDSLEATASPSSQPTLPPALTKPTRPEPFIQDPKRQALAAARARRLERGSLSDNPATTMSHAIEPVQTFDRDSSRAPTMSPPPTPPPPAPATASPLSLDPQPSHSNAHPLPGNRDDIPPFTPTHHAARHRPSTIHDNNHAQVLITMLGRPFLALHNRTWLHDRSGSDIHKLLFDTFRYRKHLNRLNHGNDDSILRTIMFMDRAAEARRWVTLAHEKGLLPTSMDVEEVGRSIGEMADQEEMKDVDETWVVKEYADERMPLQMRVFGQQVIGRPIVEGLVVGEMVWEKLLLWEEWEWMGRGFDWGVVFNGV